MSTQATFKISVLIVDDHPPLRAGVRAILEQTSDIYVAGEAENGDEAERLLDELRPRIVLLDLKMPGFSPSAFEKWARENYPETITLVLTAHDRDAYLASMMNAGAAGYLDKSERAENLITAIRSAAYGETLFTQEQMQRVLEWNKDKGKKWGSLTKRERQVLTLIGEGLGNKSISRRLSISIKTTEQYVSSILKKLNTHTRQEASTWLVENVPEEIRRNPE